MRNKTLVMVLAVGLAACGGGDDVSGTNTSDLNGLYGGSFSQPGVGVYQIAALIYNGELFAVTSDNTYGFHGKFSADATNADGSLTTYDSTGTQVQKSSVDATYMKGVSIDGTANPQSGPDASFALDYDPLYERDSSFAAIADTYTRAVSGVTFTVTISSTGQVAGSNTNGCVYSGSVTIPDPTVNIYRANISFSGCGSGSGSGYATLIDNTSASDTLIVGLVNNQGLTILALNRT